MNLDSKNLEIDFSKTTFDGVRREHLRQWQRLTIRQRLEALDELCAIAEKIMEWRKRTVAGKDVG
ncbi:MAG: hypothetical protein HYX66_09470 [Ignavibacteria bacterium]|nr:hypothetical protein [Ignavibacteria bacterium]